MVKPLSNDLRKRVVAAVAKGENSRELNKAPLCRSQSPE